MKRILAILGGGGHSKVVADCAELRGWSEIQLFDDGSPPPGPWPISGSGQSLLGSPGGYGGVIVGIGSNGTRLNLTRALEERGANLVTLIHPNAVVSRHAHVGAGSVAFAGAIVNAGARLGKGVIVNSSATVDHDCGLADGVHVSPGAHLGGGVSVGEGTWIGIGAIIREGMTIGSNAMIGAGAVVIRPVAAGATVVGNPARVLKKDDPC